MWWGSISFAACFQEVLPLSGSLLQLLRIGKNGHTELKVEVGPVSVTANSYLLLSNQKCRKLMPGSEKKGAFLGLPLPALHTIGRILLCLNRICFNWYKILSKLFYHAYFTVSCSWAYVIIVHHLLMNEPYISVWWLKEVGRCDPQVHLGGRETK